MIYIRRELPFRAGDCDSVIERERGDKIHLRLFTHWEGARAQSGLVVMVVVGVNFYFQMNNLIFLKINSL